jgi:hypothetical protein
MNERIKLLAEQAHVYAGGHSLWCHTGDVEKFAELIVKECARLADNSPQYIDGREILEHFGVEE